MIKDLYTDTGRPDYYKIRALSGIMNILIGGRRIGKTYGYIQDWHLYRPEEPFLYVRSTPAAAKNVFSPTLSPFSPINEDHNAHYEPQKMADCDIIGIYDAVNYQGDGKRHKLTGDPVAYACALSQVGTLRGFNLDNVTEILYDEFIKHPGEIIRNYDDFGTMFTDLYVTVNNEREARGKPPVKSWLLGNSDNLDNPILSSFRLIGKITQMIESGDNYYFDSCRKIAIFLLTDAPIKSEFKRGDFAALLQGTSYYAMAYDNDFVNDDFAGCGLQPVGQYRPLFTVGGYVVAAHKDKDKVYCYPGRADGVRQYATSKTALLQMIDDHGYLYYNLLSGTLLFANYETKNDICRYFAWK